MRLAPPVAPSPIDSGIDRAKLPSTVIAPSEDPMMADKPFSPYASTLAIFLRHALAYHNSGPGRGQPLKIRYDLSAGVWHGGSLTYPPGAAGAALISSCRTVSASHFYTAVAQCHRSVVGWASVETVRKPADPARNLFVPAWYAIITIDVAAMPTGAALGAALREAIAVKSFAPKMRW
jgi:hypothetical protein